MSEFEEFDYLQTKDKRMTYQTSLSQIERLPVRCAVVKND